MKCFIQRDTCTNKKTFVICFILHVKRFKFVNKFKRKNIEKRF